MSIKHFVNVVSAGRRYRAFPVQACRFVVENISALRSDGIAASNIAAIVKAPTVVALGAVLSITSVSLSSVVHAQSDRLSLVKENGVVRCGVSAGLKGFSLANSLGDYSGLDSDFCRAVASAVFDDPTAVSFTPLTAAERFDVLASGDIDVLARNTTWTMSRNSLYGNFVGVNYYDGQGFMVPKRSGIRSALELDNQGICVIKGTTTELNAIDFFNVANMRYRPVYHDTNEQAKTAYDEGRCKALTNDRSALAANRSTLKEPAAHRVLPEIISKEPLGPVVPKGDDNWTNLVRWTLNCMVNAEEMGISSVNLQESVANANPAAKRLLGVEGDFGSVIGVDNRWCYNVIKHIGNYAESYERNVGENTVLGLSRGVNKLWTDGGLIYAPPIR